MLLACASSGQSVGRSSCSLPRAEGSAFLFDLSGRNTCEQGHFSPCRNCSGNRSMTQYGSQCPDIRNPQIAKFSVDLGLPPRSVSPTANMRHIVNGGHCSLHPRSTSQQQCGRPQFGLALNASDTNSPVNPPGRRATRCVFPGTTRPGLGRPGDRSPRAPGRRRRARLRLRTTRSARNAPMRSRLRG
jgi:hypothetical protein